ncbi:MAG: DUF2017 family protein [Bowdeniella nasicola]|nr:DUF2017 family protein [Bowdeniella nasicola]
MIATEFQRESAGYVSRVPPEILHLVHRTAESLIALLSAHESGEYRRQADLALAQLFPPMSLEDPELALELHDAHQREICAEKITHLRIFDAHVDTASAEVSIAPDEVDQVVRAMADLRIYLSARLEKRQWDSTDFGGDASGLRAQIMLGELLNFLTWWQASLMENLGFGAETP